MHKIQVRWDESEVTEDMSEEDTLEEDEDSASHGEAGMEEDDTLNIQDLKITLPERVMVLGGSESGKTTLIRHLVAQMQKHNRVACVWYIGSNSAEETWVPAKFRRAQVSKPLLDNIRKVQRNKQFEGLHQVIVIDDALSESFHRDKWWNQYIST